MIIIIIIIIIIYNNSVFMDQIDEGDEIHQPQFDYIVILQYRTHNI